MKNKILVVDDETSIRDSLDKVLHAENYETVTAANGEEAVAKFGEEKFDLLLLDLGLPVKDGWSTVEWLSRVNPLLPIIIITGRHAQRALAERAGVDALMEKPLNIPRLLEMIHELLSEPMANRIQRAKDRSSGLRFVSCDHELFLEMLRERFVTPYPCPDLKNN